MPARTCLFILVLLAGLANARAQELVPDQALEIELETSNPLLEGHGPSRTFEYDVSFDGVLHVWAASNEFDPILRITSADGELLAQDDDGGGGTTAYIELAVTRNEVPSITVAASHAGATGKLVLHVSEAPKGDAPDLTSERKRIDESNAAREARDYDTARSLRAEVVSDLLARPATEQNAAWFALLDSAAHAAYEAQDPHTANAAWSSVLEIRSRVLPDEHSDLQAVRQNLAGARYLQGDFAGARTLLEKKLEVESRILPDDDPSVQDARVGLAMTLLQQGDVAGARDLRQKVLEVRSRTLPADHLDLARARVGLAQTLATLGDFEAARALDEPALEVLSRALREDDPELVGTRSNLSTILYEQGDLTGALVLQRRQLEVVSHALPADHPHQATVRGDLGTTLLALGDLAGARVLLEQALELRSRMLPADHPYVVRTRKSVAIVLIQSGDLEGARALLEDVLEIQSRALPADDVDLAHTREALAVVLQRLGDLAGARALLERVIDVLSRTLPEDHLDLATARENLAATLYHCGDLAGSKALLEQVCDVRSRTLPADDAYLVNGRLTLAATFAAECVRVASRGVSRNGEEEQRRRERCAMLVLETCRAQARAAREMLVSSASREAEERCAQLSKVVERSLSLARSLGVFARTPELEAACFELSETTRSAGLASAAVARRAAGHERYAELRAALGNASDELADLVPQPGVTSEDFDRARTKRETAERELSALARELSGGTLAAVDLDVATLSTSLGERAAAVGFRLFTDYVIEVHEDAASTGSAVVRDAWTDRLFAFVVRGAEPGERSSADAAGALTLVDLGPIEPIERAVAAWRSSLGAGSGRGLGVAAAAPARDERALASSVRELVFDPLLVAIGDRERVVLALDDVLHLVPFDVLPLDAGGETLLRDRWKIETRATLSELLANSAAGAGSGGFLGVGGVSYDGSGADAIVAAALDESDTKSRTPQVAAVLRGGPDSRGFGALPATQQEVEGLGQLFAEAFGPEASLALLEREQANKTRLLERAPAARFVHIATHGWFAPESITSWSDRQAFDARNGLALRMSGEDRIRGMSPMLLCGLALAGANLPEDAVGRAPGLVTADELSTLDLSNCELVVLSACDTNVGERRAGQGVASLQKALQMAGARSVITSLWKVPDEATKELMLDFYRRMWVEKKPKSQALWEAKLKLRNAKDERGQPLYTTRDWAAWVLTGDPN